MWPWLCKPCCCSYHLPHCQSISTFLRLIIYWYVGWVFFPLFLKIKNISQMHSAVDWALKANYLSIFPRYKSWTGGQRGEWKGLPLHFTLDVWGGHVEREVHRGRRVREEPVRHQRGGCATSHQPGKDLHPQPSAGGGSKDTDKGCRTHSVASAARDPHVCCASVYDVPQRVMTFKRHGARQEQPTCAWRATRRLIWNLAYNLGMTREIDQSLERKGDNSTDHLQQTCLTLAMKRFKLSYSCMRARRTYSTSIL